jgi:hypothetical protein
LTTEITTQITIPNVPATTRAKLESLAEKDHRSLAAYLRILLEKHVQATDTFALSEAETPVIAAA